jgi:hypothetical protein
MFAASCQRLLGAGASCSAASAPETSCVSASVSWPVLWLARAPLALFVIPRVVAVDLGVEVGPLTRLPRLPGPPRLPRPPLRAARDACTTVSRPFTVCCNPVSTSVRSTVSHCEGSRRIEGAKPDWRCVDLPPLPPAPLPLAPLPLAAGATCVAGTTCMAVDGGTVIRGAVGLLAKAVNPRCRPRSDVTLSNSTYRR